MKLPQLFEIENTQYGRLLFRGINKNEIISDEELADGKNLDSELIPAICPRKPIEKIKKLNDPQFFQIINGKLCYIDGTDFYYDGTKKGTVKKGKKSVIDFNGNIVIFPDKKYYDYVEDEWGEFEAPDIDYATVHYNRIFGIKGSDVRASKPGQFKEMIHWEDFSGTALDSWAADVYSPGDFTGITTYQDHVVFFKGDQMYELYGYIPSQFKILETAKVGCIDYRSIAEVAGMLFFVNEKGVQVYTGGMPRTISQKLNIQKLTSGVGIGDGRKYYISFDGTTYIYDTWSQLWYPYLDKEIINFSKDDKDIYALASDGYIYKLESGDEQVEWMAETKIYDEGLFNKKYLKAIRLKLKMDLDAELKVYVRVDEGDYRLRHYLKNTELYHKTHRESIIKIPMQRASNYQIKLEGKGRAIVYGEKEYAVGSDKQ